MAYTIELDKPRDVAFGTFALRTFEHEMGYPTTELDFSRIGIDVISCLIYVGVKQLDRRVTRDQIDAAIDTFLDGDGEIGESMEVIGEAMQDSGWFKNPTEADSSPK